MASNTWVLSGRKTASGRPLLANDIHLEGNRLRRSFVRLLRRNGRRRGNRRILADLRVVGSCLRLYCQLPPPCADKPYDQGNNNNDYQPCNHCSSDFVVHRVFSDDCCCGRGTRRPTLAASCLKHEVAARQVACPERFVGKRGRRLTRQSQPLSCRSSFRTL